MGVTRSAGIGLPRLHGKQRIMLTYELGPELALVQAGLALLAVEDRKRLGHPLKTEEAEGLLEHLGAAKAKGQE